jgi:hypothetical protein
LATRKAFNGDTGRATKLAESISNVDGEGLSVGDESPL